MGRSRRVVGSGVGLAGLCLLSACGDHVVLTAPDGVGHWALVALDLDGVVAASTPLRPIETRLDFELAVGHRALLYAYSPGVIEALGAGAPDDEPLHARRGCEAALPVPNAVYALSGDALVPADVGTAPELAATWLGRRCDGLEVDELLLDLGCVGTRCLPTVTREGCRFEVDDNGCGGSSFAFGLDASGAVCVEGDKCTAATNSEYSLAAMSCERRDESGGCSVLVHRAAEFPPLLEERVAVLDVEPVYPEVARYSPYVLRRGHLADLLVASDRVFVTSSRIAAFGPAFCRFPTERQQLHVYAKDDLRLLEIRELDRCALAPILLPDDRFLAFTVDGGSSSLLAHLFDSEGQQVRTATVAFTDFPVANVAASLRLGPDRNLVLLASPQEARGVVFMLRDDGSPEWIQALDSIEPWGLAPFRDGFVITDSEGNGFVTFGPAGERRMTIPVTDTVSRDLAEPWRHAASGNVVAPMPRDLAQVPILKADGSLHPQRAVSFERTAVPTAAGDWPPDPRLLLVGLTSEEPEPIAYVGRIDPVQGGFVPGLHRVGPGVISTMKTDREGRIYALLAWAAQLVRLTPQ